MAISRRVNVTAGAATTAASAVKVTARKPTIKVTAAKAKPTVVVAAKPAPKAKAAPRIVHSVDTLYQGDSKGLNARKSSTKLDVASFNTKPDMVLTERTELVLQSLKNTYARATFARGNIDAGVLKYAIWKGHLQPVSGDGGEDTMLRFTSAGMSYVAGQTARKGKRAAVA